MTEKIISPIELSEEEKTRLLELARLAIEKAVRNEPLPRLSLAEQSAVFRYPAASFVTLTKNDRLRGCIGALEASQPLMDDVIVHAVAAATNDYRFPQVTIDELKDLVIEISVLTPPTLLEYETPSDLEKLIRPGKDGVILEYGHRRATFLPQVWEKLPDLEMFLGHLCQKMGVSQDFWEKNKLQIFLYRVISFKEEN